MERLKPAIVFLLLKILILGATIPTVDTYLDLGLCWNLYMGGHYLWSLAILLPVLLCFVFTSVAFYQFPFQLSYHQYIDIPALILQVVHTSHYSCLNQQYFRYGLNTFACPLPMRSSLERKAGGPSGSTTPGTSPLLSPSWRAACSL